MLSGGSTPGATFEALSRYDLPWKSVNVGLVDDRWVDETDPGSNGALLRRTLLKNKARAANFIPMKSHHDTPHEAVSFTEKAYTKFSRPFSIVLLGMGADGHTASWFPDASGLDQALNMDSGMTTAPITAQASDVTGPYLDRMTLTLPAIANANAALLLLTGEDKARVFKHAKRDAENRHPAPSYPITHAISALGDHLTILYAD